MLPNFDAISRLAGNIWLSVWTLRTRLGEGKKRPRGQSEMLVGARLLVFGIKEYPLSAEAFQHRP